MQTMNFTTMTTFQYYYIKLLSILKQLNVITFKYVIYEYNLLIYNKHTFYINFWRNIHVNLAACDVNYRSP